ncbi:MAG: ATP-dependent RecD-like DNA helicase [Proteobacteria bacterium]|nr:ATP-dependent RecD-like DNA helicase [Pseudomonadota bacterium]
MTAESGLQERAVIIKTVHCGHLASGFRILRVYPEGGKPSQWFDTVGNYWTVKEGERLIIRGSFEKNPEYGMQFVMKSFEIPDMVQRGMRTFLVEGFLKGVGPSLGSEIYRVFGEDAADILDNAPERLLEVKGVGKQKLETIMESWHEQRGRREALAMFSTWNLGPATIHKIFARWPNPRDAYKQVKDNPYLLAWEIKGVGFMKADEIARNMGYPLDSPHRAQAAIAFALDEAAKQGHCYLPRDVLFTNVAVLLFPETVNQFVSQATGAYIEDNLQALIFAGRCIDEPHGVYLRPLYSAEVKLSEHIARLLQARVVAPSDMDAKISRFEQQNGYALHPLQRDAVKSSLSNKVNVITGSPGTGKTTIVRCLLALYLPDQVVDGQDLPKVNLVAPTGKAAKRLSESTGQPASTIHRLLNYKQGSGFEFNADHPMDVDLLICDETSMLDVYLARSLCAALPNKARLVLVGDVNQLPSVNAGCVLHDLIKSGCVPVVRLSQIYRQSANSFISLNAQAILEGRGRDMAMTRKIGEGPADDFYWLPVDDEASKAAIAAMVVAKAKPDYKEPQARAELIQKKVINAVKRLLKRGVAAQDIQVLSSTKGGAAGTYALNECLQNLINPHGAEFSLGKNSVFRIGDRVMQLRNNYNNDVFNGDLGVVQGWDAKERLAVVSFDGRPVEYKAKDMMDQITLAYATTVHKAQGSEAPYVVMPVTSAQYMMLQRNLIYTGVTRAKTWCILVGEKRSLNMAINRNEVLDRNTFLSERLRRCM